MPACDPWQILGIPPGSPPDEIRRAYRRLALRHHPDLHGGDREAERRFMEIADAYRRLTGWAASDGAEDREEGLLARLGREAGRVAAALWRVVSPGAKTVFTVEVSPAEAMTGCERPFLLEGDGRDGTGSLRSTIVLPIPPGSADGDRLHFTWRGGEAVATVRLLSDDERSPDAPVPG